MKWTQEIRDIHTSMYDDWKAGRPTEIDYLNGFIVNKGQESGIPTPVNEALTAMIKVIIVKREIRPGCGAYRRGGRAAGRARPADAAPASEEYHVDDIER